MRLVWLTLALSGCGNSSGTPIDAREIDAREIDAGPDAFELTLDKTPGNYRESCDGSGALAIDLMHFIDVNDEDQIARIYQRAMDAAPVQEIDLTDGLGVNGNDEADLEDLERIGTRVFAITSHGRKSSGNLDRARYRFAAFDQSGAPPTLMLTSVGATEELLDQLLIASNWDTPNTAVIDALVASSNLGDPSDPDLAPENMGTNIEALASNGATALLIGFRNPRPAGNAVVVALANPDGVVNGEAPEITGAAQLDLGGLGIRSMAWSAEHDAVLILAGPHNPGGPFRLYQWSGALTEAAVMVQDLTVPAEASPEAIVPYPGTKDVQIVFDQGDALISGTACKDSAAGVRVFRDLIVRVP